ncbi:MAG: hypothetical protein KDE26_09875 [Bacteroidetes bacterium]|nr:hypothetical protein [Bacteroidota bacterium]
MNNHIFTLVFILLFSGTTAFSQTQKGTILLGGNANIGLASTNDFTAVSFSLSPNIGLFVANQFALGFSPHFNYSQIEAGNGFSAAGGGIFARYYIPLGEKVNPFLFARAGFSATQTIVPNIPAQQWAGGFQGGGGAGLAFFLNQSIALEVVASYQRLDFNGIQRSNDLSLRAGFQIHLPQAD